MASRKSTMQVGNKLAAIAKMMEAGHMTLARQYAHPSLLYFGGYASNLPHTEIAAAVESGDVAALRRMSAELIDKAVGQP